jgi:uncharacterized membrane protein
VRSDERGDITQREAHMAAMIYFGAYAAGLMTFLALDGIWLGLVARDFYGAALGGLISGEVDFVAAGLFYIGYVGGITFLAVRPAFHKGAWRTAALNGAVLGVVAYGAYDLTNLATIAGWPVAMSIVDMVWGGVLSAVVASVAYGAGQYLRQKTQPSSR